MSEARDESFFREINDNDEVTLDSSPSIPAAARDLKDMIAESTGSPAKRTRRIGVTQEQRQQERELAKMQEEEAWARRAGFPAADLRFAMGTELVDSGHHAYQESRKTFEELPFASDAMEAISTQIKSENRRDITLKMSDLGFDGEGNALIHGEQIQIEEPAIDDLCQVIGIYRGGKFIATCPPDLRAEILNRWIFELWTMPDLDKEIQLRTRNGSGPRRIFAAVTTSYAKADGNDVADLFAKVVPSGAKGEVMYDGRKLRLRALFHAPSDWPVAVGSNYKAGIELLTDDVGERSLRMRSLLWQAICVNLSTVERGVDIWRQVHRGSFDLNRLIEYGYGQAMSKLAPFVEAWGEAEIRTLVEAELRHGDVEPVFAKMVSDRMIPKMTGVTDQEMVRRLRRAYWEHPSPTSAGIISAVTQIAHREPWRSPWAQDDLQEAAGVMVNNSVFIQRMGDATIKSAEAKGWKPQSFSLDDIYSGAINQAPVFTLSSKVDMSV